MRRNFVHNHWTAGLPHSDSKQKATYRLHYVIELNSNGSTAMGYGRIGRSGIRG